jgi:hypothetical protein
MRRVYSPQGGMGIEMRKRETVNGRREGGASDQQAANSRKWGGKVAGEGRVRINTWLVLEEKKIKGVPSHPSVGA